jgi:hypothetical protein
MNLTEATYYGPEANHSYFSVSQLKRFMECPAAAMAELKGEYTPDRGRALILGSYVDEALTGTEESFKQFCEEQREELYQKRGGKKLADVVQADEAIAKAKQQPLIVEYLEGEKQKIFTGVIDGVLFKGKLDIYKDGERIVDLKYVASHRSPNLFENVVDYWNYTLQGAIYVELVRQNTGKTLPFYLILITKEKPAHFAVVKLDQIDMDIELDKARKRLPLFQAIKNGEIPPERCEAYLCNFCTETKILTEPIPVSHLGKSRFEVDAMNGVI